MRRTTLATIGILVLLAIVVIIYAFFRPGISPNSTSASSALGDSPASTASPSGSQNSAPNSPDTSQTPVAGTIYIKDILFSPTQLTIQAGSAVSWVNNDEVAHTVTLDQGSSNANTGPASGNIAPGVSYSYTFNTAGTYQYHCDIHRSMHGTIIVQ